MQNIEIIKQTPDNEPFEVYTCGYPDFDALNKTEKRLLLSPLVETICNFYKEPENRQRFEKWKVNREKTKSTT